LILNIPGANSTVLPVTRYLFITVWSATPVQTAVACDFHWSVELKAAIITSEGGADVGMIDGADVVVGGAVVETMVGIDVGVVGRAIVEAVGEAGVEVLYGSSVEVASGAVVEVVATAAGAEEG
jgi:hypothetical protein